MSPNRKAEVGSWATQHRLRKKIQEHGIALNIRSRLRRSLYRWLRFSLHRQTNESQSKVSGRPRSPGKREGAEAPINRRAKTRCLFLSNRNGARELVFQHANSPHASQ